MMRQHVEMAVCDIWSFYSADDIQKRAYLWSHQTFMLVLDSPSTLDYSVKAADENTVEFEVVGRCDDGHRATVRYVLYTEICFLEEEKKERLVREVKRAFAGSKDPFNGRARSVAKALGVSYTP